MNPPIRLDAPTGHLQLRLSPVVTITEKTTPADLPQLFPTAAITPMPIGSGWTHYHVHLEQADWLIVLVLRCIGHYLIEWQLVFTQDQTPRNTWAEWDDAAERQQAIRYHEWLTTQLGRSDGRWQFDWGEVWVGYEARSGSSSILVRYGGPEPTPRPA